MDYKKAKKIYISGIGGIGVSDMARFFIEQGAQVSGSDKTQSDICSDLQKAGVTVYYQQDKENVKDDIDLFIYSAAVPENNAERQKAKELGIEQKSYPEVLAEISVDYRTIAVSGTNGKSSTTAMLASALIEGEKDPTVILGSQYEKLDKNFRAGRSDLFLLEACEYRAHMLLLNPQTIIITNLEEEHLDFYRDINHIIQTFQQYIQKLKPNDFLIINNDDINLRELRLPNCRVVRFGLIEGADVRAENIRKLPGKQIFKVIYYGQDLGDFELNVPGDYNIYNALGAMACALEKGVSIGQIKKALSSFSGLWRRFEIIKNKEYTVVSDNAHHPTAVEQTIKATKEFMPGRRVVAVFQPHQKDRTQKLFKRFMDALEQAEVIILPEIYDVVGREEGLEISSKDLLREIKKQYPNKEVYFAPDLSQTVDKVNQIKKDEDIILIMGAGDVYKIAEKI